MSKKKLDYHIKMAKLEIYKDMKNTRYVSKNILKLKAIESGLPRFPENEEEYKEKIRKLQDEIHDSC